MAKLYICICVDAEGPASYSKFKSWKDIDNQLSIVNSEIFRKNKENLVLNWFVSDWTGWNKDNLYGRDLGFDKVYNKIVKKYDLKKFKDGIYWHYHHPFSDGSWKNGGWNPNWLDNNEYEKQLAYWIIERKDFPLFYRAGGTIETNEQSRWLEKFIPFDFSSRANGPSWFYKLKLAGYYLLNNKINLSDRMTNLLNFLLRSKSKSNPLWNWNKAKDNWDYYHPSNENYQIPGNMNRYVFRCLDIRSSAFKINENEIRKAMKRVIQGKDTILSVFSHDFYDLAEDIRYFLNKFKEQAKKYPNLKYEFSNCENACKNILNLKKQKIILDFKIKKNKLLINFQNAFGDSPIVCSKSNETYSLIKGYKEKTNGNIKIREYNLDLKKIDKLGLAFIDKNQNKIIKILT